MTRTPDGPFDCERVSSRLDPYLLDQVPPSERSGMRRHIHGCRACFEKVVARDPLQLFAPLADQEQPGPFWEGFWPAIQEGILQEEARRRARRVWAGAAAVILAVAAGAGALVLAPRYLPRPAGEPAAPPAVVGAGEAPWPGELPPPLPQTVEQVRSGAPDGVQVYSMNYYQGPLAGSAGGAGERAGPVAELVLIVDAGLEL